MKKWIALLVALTLTAGCVTSPITTANFNHGVAPVHPVPAIVTGLVPGFTQLLNREWAEAAIYFAGGVLPAVIAYAVSGPTDAILYFREYTEYDPVWRYLPVHSEAWRTVVYYTGFGISGAFWATGFVDGIVTSAVRHKQWSAIADQLRPQRHFTSGNEALWERFWYEQKGHTLGAYVIVRDDFAYYLSTSVEYDDFTEGYTRQVDMMVLQNHKRISSDIRYMEISFVVTEEKGKLPRAALIHEIHSEEWFFFQDYVDIKFGDRILRVDGESDSRTGRSAGQLTTYLISSLTPELRQAVEGCPPGSRIIDRVYTKEGYFDVEIPDYFFGMCKGVFLAGAQE